MNKATLLVFICCAVGIVILAILMNFPIVYLCSIINWIILFELIYKAISDIPNREKEGKKRSICRHKQNHFICSILSFFYVRYLLRI